MKTSLFRTFAAGLTIVGLLGTATKISAATAIAAKKAKTNGAASGTDRQAEPAASTPLGKSKPSAKSRTPAKPKRRTKTKATVNKGVFAADITTNGRTRTIKSPTAAVSALRRAAAAKRRADKTGKADDTFKVVVNLNDVRIEFTDPAVAEEACRELVKVLIRARKERIFLGDIGRIEPADMVAGEALPTTGTDSTPVTPPKAKKKRRRMSRKQKQQAAAQANARLLAARRALQLRINMKIQMEVRKNRGRRLSQSRIQQIYQAEIEQARKDGLIPAGAQNGGTGSAGSGGREAHIEAYRHELGRAFAKGKRLDAEN